MPIKSAIQAISNPHRRKILKLVWQQELPAREIAVNFDVTWPAISQNLRILSDAGLVDVRRDGVRRFYKANKKALKPIEQVLTAMWSEDLKQLKSAVEHDTRKRKSP